MKCVTKNLVKAYTPEYFDDLLSDAKRFMTKNVIPDRTFQYLQLFSVKVGTKPV